MWSTSSTWQNFLLLQLFRSQWSRPRKRQHKWRRKGASLRWAQNHQDLFQGGFFPCILLNPHVLDSDPSPVSICWQPTPDMCLWRTDVGPRIHLTPAVPSWNKKMLTSTVLLFLQHWCHLKNSHTPDAQCISHFLSFCFPQHFSYVHSWKLIKSKTVINHVNQGS